MVNGSGIWTYSLYLFDSAFILVSSSSWQGVPVSAFMNFLMRFLVTDTLRDNYRIGFLIGFIFYELQFVIIFFRLKKCCSPKSICCNQGCGTSCNHVSKKLQHSWATQLRQYGLPTLSCHVQLCTWDAF